MASLYPHQQEGQPQSLGDTLGLGAWGTRESPGGLLVHVIGQDGTHSKTPAGSRLLGGRAARSPALLCLSFPLRPHQLQAGPLQAAAQPQGSLGWSGAKHRHCFRACPSCSSSALPRGPTPPTGTGERVPGGQTTSTPLQGAQSPGIHWIFLVGWVSKPTVGSPVPGSCLHPTPPSGNSSAKPR